MTATPPPTPAPPPPPSPHDPAPRFDLIVIGAGINGTGIARDAAMRGMRVLVLDQGDIGGGASSWNTRLIHGGLRYLERLEISLVRESLRERERLLRNAPHLVRPVRLLIPLYRGARRGRFTIGIGLTAYELLARGSSLARHRMLSPARALAAEPSLNPEGLTGAAEYSDAAAPFAERLSVENALSARDLGAAIRPYGRATGFILDGTRVRGVHYIDAFTGEPYRALAPLTINAAGSWADRVLGMLGRGADPLIGGTKGSHLVIGPFEGAPGRPIYVEARSDGRPIFVIPWMGQYLIGTTDVRFDGDPAAARADPEEVAYLLDELNRLFPRAGVTEAHIRFTYTGVRPLPDEPDARPGTVTRRHILHDHAPDLPGLVTIIGGKLTTFRSLAEQVVDLAERRLGRPHRECLTGRTPLPGAGGPGEADLDRTAALLTEAGLTESSAGRLLSIYGVRAARVLEIARRHPDLSGALRPGGAELAAEIVFAFEEELATTIGDALFRRTLLALEGDLGLGVLDGALEVARRFLGWDDRRVGTERASYLAEIERFRPPGIRRAAGPGA